MRLYVDIKYMDCFYSFMLNPNPFQRIEVPNYVIIDIFKHSNHCYCFKAFSYVTTDIHSTEYTRTKGELYSAILNYLKEKLYHVEQIRG